MKISIIFKQFVSDSIRVERDSPDFSFLWLSGWVDPNKNTLFYLILFTYWALIMDLEIVRLTTGLGGFKLAQVLVPVWPMGSGRDINILLFLVN